MFRVFYFAFTLATGQHQEPIFAVVSDCEVARHFVMDRYPDAKVGECGVKLVGHD